MLKDYFENIKNISYNAKLFLLGGIFNGLGMAVFGLLFNLYLKENGFGETLIGYILSAGALGTTVVALPAAIFIERIHIKYILFYSTFLSAIAYFLQIYFNNINYIILFSFLANMFITVYRVAGAPFFMKNSTPKERIYLFSINAAIGMFSQFLGFFLGGYLPNLLIYINIAENKMSAYKISLYLSILGSLLSLFPFMKITDSNNKMKTDENYYFKLNNYNWLLIGKLMIPKILVGLGAGLIIPFMNLYFKNVFHLESKTIGFYFSIMQIFMFIGMASAPLLIKKLNMICSIVLTEMISIPFMFIMAITDIQYLAVIAFIFRGMLMNMSAPISANFEMELVSEKERAMTNAISTLAWNGAWTISSYFGGKIIERYSFQYSFYVTIVLYILSALTYYLFFNKYDKKKINTQFYLSCGGIED